MRISVELVAVLVADGCDVYFLNRPAVKAVHRFDDLAHSFRSRPSGLTPITAVLAKVLRNNMPGELCDRKLLTIIVTDGEPTSNEGE